MCDANLKDTNRFKKATQNILCGFYLYNYKARDCSISTGPIPLGTSTVSLRPASKASTIK